LIFKLNANGYLLAGGRFGHLDVNAVFTQLNDEIGHAARETVLFHKVNPGHLTASSSKVVNPPGEMCSLITKREDLPCLARPSNAT
jgi:hypothetical protein